ncbi:MAG: hypothetical protein CMO81_09250 [Waddliaceae bacterium]|nr:hypothetical protein [Waddliaceae bacterium]|tara:strand:+ start:41 stop:931 length:891 start_codon:yes stop_codon:yes gene_type:complete
MQIRATTTDSLYLQIDAKQKKQELDLEKDTISLQEEASFSTTNFSITDNDSGNSKQIPLTTQFVKEVMKVHNSAGAMSLKVHQKLKEGTLTLEEYRAFLGVYLLVYTALERAVSRFQFDPSIAAIVTPEVMAVLAKKDDLIKALSDSGVQSPVEYAQQFYDGALVTFTEHCDKIDDARDLLPMCYVIFSGHFNGGPNLRSYVASLIENHWEGQGSNAFYTLSQSEMLAVDSVKERALEIKERSPDRDMYWCTVKAYQGYFKNLVNSLPIDQEDCFYMEGKAEEAFLLLCSCLAVLN